jgi:hypothetical protein
MKKAIKQVSAFVTQLAILNNMEVGSCASAASHILYISSLNH